MAEALLTLLANPGANRWRRESFRLFERRLSGWHCFIHVDYKAIQVLSIQCDPCEYHESLPSVPSWRPRPLPPCWLWLPCCVPNTPDAPWSLSFALYCSAWNAAPPDVRRASLAKFLPGLCFFHIFLQALNHHPLYKHLCSLVVSLPRLEWGPPKGTDLFLLGVHRASALALSIICLVP